MDTKNRPKLADRVTKAAETAFAIEDYVAPVDVLMGIGWLDGNTRETLEAGAGRKSLEHAIQTNPARISEAMEIFRSWAEGEGVAGEPEPRMSRGRRNARLCASLGAGIPR